MAGIDVGQGRGPRRNVIADVQPIPMIDLMMVIIAFLLITAVWSQMARMDVSANAPHRGEDPDVPTPTKTLHVDVQDDKFVVSWHAGTDVTDRFDLPRHPIEYREGPLRVVRYPNLSAKLQETWASFGAHRDPSDRTLDRAVLHTPDGLPYSDLVAALDAIHSVKRPMASSARAPGQREKGGTSGQRDDRVRAFDVVFAIK